MCFLIFSSLSAVSTGCFIDSESASLRSRAEPTRVDVESLEAKGERLLRVDLEDWRLRGLDCGGEGWSMGSGVGSWTLRALALPIPQP